MDVAELLIGVAVLVGVLGVVVPVLPGSLLILAAVLVWATEDGSRTAWTVFAGVAVLLLAGGVVKYAVPGRNLKATGVPNRSIAVGGLLGFAGFFAVPVVGLFLGFVAGVYLAERGRVGAGHAWPSTRAALKAVAASVLIELVTALLAASLWLTGAVLT